MPSWPTVPLTSLADIRVSNVDKKSKSGEKPVRLCNYMDVYSNDYITADLSFMESTASASELAKFGVCKGDAFITKDSETPYDIGIPSVADEDFEGLVCGYHLALIRPRDKGAVDSAYLSKQLASAEVAAYYARMAGGSTRYGLSTRAIEQTPIRLPPIGTQQVVARVLRQADQAIEKTEALIEKYQQIKAGLMHDLFTRGIGADGKLRPPREQAPELYQETPIGWIPKDWGEKRLDEISDVLDPNPSHRNPIYSADGFPFISTVEFEPHGKILLDTSRRVVEEIVLEQEQRCRFSKDSIAFSRKGTIGEIRFLPGHVRFALLDSLCVINAKEVSPCFLFQVLKSSHLRRQIKNMTMGQALPQMSIGRVRDLLVPAPTSQGEQSQIEVRLTAIDDKLLALATELAKLKQVKAGLMHDLLSGNVEVTNV